MTEPPKDWYNRSIDIEPLIGYQTGGYHPIELGQFLKDERYHILHKLGWGPHHTTWAARDIRLADAENLE